MTLIAAFIAAAAIHSGAPGGAQVRNPQAIVRAYVEAYNARDYGKIERSLHEEAAWYSVDGARILEEGAGRTSLMRWMRKYLGETCVSCRSTLLSLGQSGDYVTTVERADWTRKDGSKASQSGIGVYRIVDGRISAVWYFPPSAFR